MLEHFVPSGDAFNFVNGDAFSEEEAVGDSVERNNNYAVGGWERAELREISATLSRIPDPQPIPSVANRCKIVSPSKRIRCFERRDKACPQKYRNGSIKHRQFVSDEIGRRVELVSSEAVPKYSKR